MITSESLYSLPLEQQIGQLLFIGLPATEFDPDARALVEHVTPGGVIAFGRNVAAPEQLRKLLDDVRGVIPTPPLLGIDQEGGLVDRLRRICTPMPAARAIRQHGDLAGARALGRITGEILRLFGFNVNFAPVLSIMTDDRDLLSNGLYSRSFGRSPGEVLGYTMVYLRGLQGPLLVAPNISPHRRREMTTTGDGRHQPSRTTTSRARPRPYINSLSARTTCARRDGSHGGFRKIDIQRASPAAARPASINYEIVTSCCAKN